MPKKNQKVSLCRPVTEKTSFCWDKGGRVGCLSLIKTDHLAERLKDFLGPMMEEMAG